MSVSPLPTEASASPFISERLAEALRGGKGKDPFLDSAFAACLLPLLRELGWKNYAKELIESLPHFSATLDLVDLRNILVSLGYDSHPVAGNVQDLQAELFPALFVSEQGEVLLLQGREDNTIHYYQPSTNQYHITDDLSLTGTSYVFTDTNSSFNQHNAQLSGNWFDNLLQRFQKMIVHLLGMTLIINLVALLVPIFIMVIYDKVIAAKSSETLPFLLIGVGILLFADFGLRFLRAKLLGMIAGRLDYLIGVETFKKLLQLPPLLTERSTVAAQLSQLKQFDSVRDFFTGQSASVVLELPFVLLFLIVIAILGGPIALIPLAMVVAFIVLGLVWLPSLNTKVARSAKAKINKQRLILQTVAGRKEIKSIGGEEVWSERFREHSGETVQSNYQTYLANNLMNNIAQALMTISGILVLTMGTLQVINGDMSIGALIATMALVWRVLSPLQSAFLSFTKLQQIVKAIRQINRLMSMRSEKSGSKSGVFLDHLKGSVQFDRVSFRYSPNADPALLGVSFKVEPGEMIAITGNTGSGKSTIIKMLAGMYAPQAGTVAFDQLDLRQLNAVDLRRAVAYVPQVIHMFHGSIAQNIRLNNALASDEDIIFAASEAGVLEEIMALPDGFNTRIGDTKVDHLPPGFLRSLSMARAFASPAKILLMDEPGASLDIESDERLIHQLRNIKGDRSIIMVSHRPSHIRLADRAILMDQGSIAHIGSPNEIVAMMLKS